MQTLQLRIRNASQVVVVTDKPYLVKEEMNNAFYYYFPYSFFFLFITISINFLYLSCFLFLIIFHFAMRLEFYIDIFPPLSLSPIFPSPFFK